MTKAPCHRTKNRSFSQPHPRQDHPANRAAIKMCEKCPLRTSCAIEALTSGTTLIGQTAPATDVIQAGVICAGDYGTAMALAIIAGVDVPTYETGGRRALVRDGDPCVSCAEPLFRWTRGIVPDGYVQHYARGYCTGCRKAYAEAYPSSGEVRVRKSTDRNRHSAPPRRLVVEAVQLSLDLKAS